MPNIKEKKTSYKTIYCYAVMVEYTPLERSSLSSLICQPVVFFFFHLFIIKLHTGCKFSNFLYKDRYWLFDIIFSIVHYGKQGLDTFDDGYVEYLLTAKLNQEAVHISVAKKCRLMWTCAWFVFNRVETNGGSLQGRAAQWIRGTQREYSSKPLKNSIVKRILVFKRWI